MASSKTISRRSRIPDRPHKPLSLWNVLKSCVGKEMTRVSMPVNFGEPLSMLQRLTEDFDYSNLLDKAAATSDDDLQLAYVAAFAISTYSTTFYRTSKPFNPLLGETYECDRTDDLGWKCFSEQVSHHPPITAIHCEGKDWIAWHNFSMSSKFRGRSIRVEPNGIFHLEFLKTKNHYTWNKVITTVNNIIIGTLWIDQSGTMIITNHNNGWKSVIEFLPYNHLKKDEQRAIKGVIEDNNGVAKWLISGSWDKKLTLELIDHKQVIAESRTKQFISKEKKKCLLSKVPIILWECIPPEDASKNYYNFTILACQLNEIEENVAPTDSRNRPDQRLMEEGNWDEANIVKTLLEESQRTRNRDLTNLHTPLWFTANPDPFDGYSLIYTFNQEYWKCKKNQDWSKCPNLFEYEIPK